MRADKEQLPIEDIKYLNELLPQTQEFLTRIHKPISRFLYAMDSICGEFHQDNDREPIGRDKKPRKFAFFPSCSAGRFCIMPPIQYDLETLQKITAILKGYPEASLPKFVKLERSRTTKIIKIAILRKRPSHEIPIGELKL